MTREAYESMGSAANAVARRLLQAYLLYLVGGVLALDGYLIDYIRGPPSWVSPFDVIVSVAVWSSHVTPIGTTYFIALALGLYGAFTVFGGWAT